MTPTPTITPTPTPTPVPESSLYAWGNGINGIFGDNTRSNRSSPVRVGNLIWKYISLGSTHTLAIRNDNTLWASGNGRAVVNGEVPDINLRQAIETMCYDLLRFKHRHQQ